MNVQEKKLQIRIQPTPNPSALKFILNTKVKADGKATFTSRDQCEGVRLAYELMSIPGVSQLHFFDNFITVTFNHEIEPYRVEGEIESVLRTRLPVHDPHFDTPDTPQKVQRRRNDSPDLEQIEEILDRTVRPGLRSDGGDIEVLSLEGSVLTVAYQGACGTCPSAVTGTLEAIRGILSHEFRPDIEVNLALTE